MQYTTQLTSKFVSLMIVIGCMSCSFATVEPERIEIKDPGPKSKNFTAPFPNVWKACLVVLGKYPLKSYDEEAGIIETDFISGESAWNPPHKPKVVRGGLRYKLNLRLIKGKSGKQPMMKVIVVKNAELQKDFFAESETLQSDGLEELAILYRIERELSLDQALSKVKRN